MLIGTSKGMILFEMQLSCFLIRAIYSAENGSESRFRVKCFFLGSTSVTYYSLFYCIIWFVLRHWSCIAPLELYCASVSQYYLSFKLSGKVVFFHLFCHLYFYFFAPAAIVHSFSNYIVALRDDRQAESKRKIVISFETGSACHCEWTVEWAIAIAI